MITIDMDERLIHLCNDRVSYAIYLLEGGVPMHLYFGARVDSLNPITLLRHNDLSENGAFSLHGSTLDHTPHE